MKRPASKKEPHRPKSNGRFQAKKGWNSPFTMVPNEILDGSCDCPPLSQSQLLIYIALCRHADNKTGECWPYYSTLAEKARCTIRTAISAIKYLCEVGLVSKESRWTECGGQTSNVYTVYLPSQRFSHPEGECEGECEEEGAASDERDDGAHAGGTETESTPCEMISPPHEADFGPREMFSRGHETTSDPHEINSPLYKVEQTQELTQEQKKEQGLAKLPPEEREAKIKNLPPAIREPILRFYRRLDASGTIRRGPIDLLGQDTAEEAVRNDHARMTTAPEASP